MIKNLKINKLSWLTIMITWEMGQWWVHMVLPFKTLGNNKEIFTNKVVKFDCSVV